MTAPKFYFENLTDYGSALKRGFEFLELGGKLNSSTRVAIKPNLTFPVFRPGVMTTPAAVEALVLFLKQFTNNITICEADSGGYNRFSMTEVFETTGIAAFADKHNVRVVNLSGERSREIEARGGWRRLRVPLPTLLLDETDLFITMPVPKVHSNTKVSLALKNQWGIIQQPSLRLKLHPYFRDVIHAVNRALPTSIAILDGRFGLTRSGPMRGDELDLNWFAMSDNLFAHDLVVSHMMGIPISRVPYLRTILRREKLTTLDSVQFNTEDIPHDTRFYLDRAWTDYPGVLTFNSRALAYIGYESLLARPLHWALYKFREPFY